MREVYELPPMLSGTAEQQIIQLREYLLRQAMQSNAEESTEQRGPQGEKGERGPAGKDASYDKIFPVGAVYVSSTNSNPSALFGGTWELVDKRFAVTSYTTPSDFFTVNSTNATLGSTGYCLREGNVIRVRVNVTNNVALTDTSVILGTFNFDALGIVDLGYTYFVTGYTDAGGGIIQGQVNYSTGALTSVDIITKTAATSIAANSSINFDLILLARRHNMLDSACNQFIWERTA